MSYPTELVENYHSVSCGQTLLQVWEAGDDYVDYFLPGEEPELSRSSAADAPDVAGRVEGPLFHRGNTRWSSTIRRWAYFGAQAYPLYTDAETPVLRYNTPEEHAASYMATHLAALPDAIATLSLNGTAFPRTVVQATGKTVGPFAVFTYVITAAKNPS